MYFLSYFLNFHVRTYILKYHQKKKKKKIDKSKTSHETFAEIKLLSDFAREDDFQATLFKPRVFHRRVYTHPRINEYHQREDIRVSSAFNLPDKTESITRAEGTRAQSTAFPFILPYRYSSGPLPFALLLLLLLLLPHPSFTWIRFSPSLLFSVPCSRAHLIAEGSAAHSCRRTTVNTHLLDQPASSLASYSTLWPPTSKRRPGLWKNKKDRSNDECSVVDVTLVNVRIALFSFSPRFFLNY